LHGEPLQARIDGPDQFLEIQLGGGPGDHADRGLAELGDVLAGELPAAHEALAVIQLDAGEIDRVAGIAGQGPGRLGEQHVELARDQRVDRLGEAQRDELGRVGVAQERRREGAAQIDLEPDPAAIGSAGRKPGPLDHAAADRAALGDRPKGRCPGLGRGGRAGPAGQSGERQPQGRSPTRPAQVISNWPKHVHADKL
jgi:hypothetical protein